MHVISAGIGLRSSVSTPFIYTVRNIVQYYFSPHRQDTFYASACIAVQPFIGGSSTPSGVSSRASPDLFSALSARQSRTLCSSTAAQLPHFNPNGWLGVLLATLPHGAGTTRTIASRPRISRFLFTSAFHFAPFSSATHGFSRHTGNRGGDSLQRHVWQTYPADMPSSQHCRAGSLFLLCFKPRVTLSSCAVAPSISWSR